MSQPQPGRMLWLDDLRPAPHGWVWVKSVNEAIEAVLCASGRSITHMSLDHDLGEYAHDGGDGAIFTDWLAEHGHWPAGIRVHSANPVGVAAMLSTVDRYSPLPIGYTNSRGASPDGGWPIARA